MCQDALLVIDLQNDFLPGGALAVPGGDRVIDPIRGLMTLPNWRAVVLTQDWHPADHVSFASSHPGRKPFESIALSYGPADAVARSLRRGFTGRCLSA